MKVYCVNCKYYYYSEFDPKNEHGCTSPKGVAVYRDTPIKREIIEYGDCLKMNKNNDCEYYVKEEVVNVCYKKIMNLLENRRANYENK